MISAMNQTQLSTLAEAKYYQDKLIKAFKAKPSDGIDGQVPNCPGILIPRYGGPYTDLEPGEAQLFYLAWQKKDEAEAVASEMNVGEIRTLYTYYTARAEMMLLLDLAQSGAI